MAFLNTHRKLSPNDSNNSNSITTVQTCLDYCDPSKNYLNSGFCAAPCLAICPSICHYSLEPLISSTQSPTQPNKPHNLSPILISMLILLASTFLLITFYVLYTKLYRSSSSHSQTQGGGSNDLVDEGHVAVFHPIWYIPTVGLHPTVISSIEVCKYSGDQKKMDGGDCAVCLAEFEEGDELRVLPKCNHAFHVPCIDQWLRSHINCPLCRAPIVPVRPTAYFPTTDQTADNISSSTPPTEDNFPGELRINIGVVEEEAMNLEGKNEGELIIRRSASMDCLELGSNQLGNLVSRSRSCRGNIFSSS